MSDELNPELESFRQQWRAEVTAKTKGESSTARTQPARPAPRTPSIVPKTIAQKLGEDRNDDQISDEEDGDISTRPRGRSFHAASSADEEDVDSVAKMATREPLSALEHYEKAVERETEGNLGDSLKLYRKAFRMDDRVDLRYKDKHFPPSSFTTKPVDLNPSNAPATVPSTAHHFLDRRPTTSKLISSFAESNIAAAEPAIEGAPAPPCPIADLPEEILIHILTDLALLDIPSIMRLAQVCKKFAFLVATEDQIWKRICLGDEVGFGGMHYAWQIEVTGELLLDSLEDVEIVPVTRTSRTPRTPRTSLAEPPATATLSDLPISPPISDTLALSSTLQPPTPSLLLSPLYSTYAKMFRFRPRIRFNGVYISTVNYIRPGQAAPSQTTWGSPVHIVTYYRYLRFFRNGAVLSLLTTHEPAEVVHALLPSRFHIKAPASSPVFNVLKGRWKLGREAEKEGAIGLDESALTVETEGVDPKYVYRMELELKGQERGRARLMWKGFWNWNRLTDDWGEFGLRNDKAFVFSRVKAYGMGA